MWFTAEFGNFIGRIETRAPNRVTVFPVPTDGAAPTGIVVGPDGNIWFGEIGNSGAIGRILTHAPNTITEFPVPGGSNVGDVAVGPDHNIWFTEAGADTVGRITPETPNTITLFPVPLPGGVPSGITAGPDGNMWFTE
jgi:virginiamycin B lyase